MCHIVASSVKQKIGVYETMNDKDHSGLSREDFAKLIRGKTVRVVVAGKYDWNKAWKYMEQKGEPVTVTEIHMKVMSEVPNRRQVRAWTKRQVKNGRLVKAKDPVSGRVFYLPRTIHEKNLKKTKKSDAEK